MDDWLTIALACGLAARLTRLITLDTITEPIRRRLPGLLGALAECQWCSGFWVAVAVGLSWWAWADQTWWQIGALIGAVAWASGALAGVGMPRQTEVAVVSPVALVNADEPVPAPAEPVFNIHSDLSDADGAERIAALVAKHLRLRDSGGITAAGEGTDGAS